MHNRKPFILFRGVLSRISLTLLITASMLSGQLFATETPSDDSSQEIVTPPLSPENSPILPHVQTAHSSLSLCDSASYITSVRVVGANLAIEDSISPWQLPNHTSLKDDLLSTHGSLLSPIEILLPMAHKGLPGLGTELSFNSWTFPPASNLPGTLFPLSQRVTSSKNRNDLFNEFSDTPQYGITKAKIGATIHVPDTFTPTGQYTAMVYLYGSGGPCDSEQFYIDHFRSKGLIVVPIKSNLSRAGGDANTASSSSDQLGKNPTNLALDALIVGNILKGHPNVKEVVAFGSSLGGVACTFLSNKEISSFLNDHARNISGIWYDSTPFKIIFPVSALPVLQSVDATVPDDCLVVGINGAYDQWCDSAAAARFFSGVRPFSSWHFLPMGHCPESQDSDWVERLPTSAMHQEDDGKIFCHWADVINPCTMHFDQPYSEYSKVNLQTGEGIECLTLKTVGTNPKPLDQIASQDLFGGLQSVLKQRYRGAVILPDETQALRVVDLVMSYVKRFAKPWEAAELQEISLLNAQAKIKARKVLSAYESIYTATTEMETTLRNLSTKLNTQKRTLTENKGINEQSREWQDLVDEQKGILKKHYGLLVSTFKPLVDQDTDGLR
ncbi:MAG: hypothetical protein H2057_00955 [Alphaproteobacteria bacterium]|nr:hypothetical protein [Alphaproteobacteria bacterium]